MTSPSAGPADQAAARTTVFRRYLFFRVSSLLVAVLALAAVVLALAFKESPVGFIASMAAFVVLLVAFQILMLKRRAHFRRLVVLKNEV